jgi:autotransporter-associated beta strand protein
VQNPSKWSAVAALCALAVAAPAPAAEYTWSGGSGGAGDAWRQANNWNPAAGQGGPASGDLATFATNGTASPIGIKFNDGLGLTAAVGAIVLSAGPDRTIFNSSPNSSGTLRLEGWQGMVLSNATASSVLALRNGTDSMMRVELASGGIIHVGAPAAGIIMESEVAGTNGFRKTGAGFLRLTHANSLGGNVVVSGGTLDLAAATGGSLASVESLRLESGATAKFSAAEQLGNATALDLAGGTLRGADGSNPVAETAGTLTLSAISTIDLRASNLRLADSSSIVWNSAATLTITNWRGVAGGDGGRLFFGVGGLTSTQLAQVYFADLGVQGAQLIGPDGELSPIPEAPVAAAAAALAGFIVWRERRRLLQAVRRRLAPRCDASASRAGRCRSAD